MKMKKTKLLIPAIGMLVFTSAASVSGTVAWFTASRAFNTTVGEFAVVNTKDNLDCVMGAGLGTSVSDNVVTVDGGQSLTDASFDHVTSDHYIIAPNDEGLLVGKKVALASATFDLNASTGIKRDANANIYSVYTWTMEFRLTMSSSASKDVGLFFDASTSRVSKKVSLESGRTVTANTYYSDAKLTTAVSGTTSSVTTAYTQNTTATTGEAVAIGANQAIPANKYYTTSACTEFVTARGASGDAMTVYAKREVVDTGIGFRLAFVGETATYSQTRVWADMQTAANCKHVVAAAAVNDSLAADGKTAAYVSPALIDSANTTDPDSLVVDADRATCLNDPTCLGYFSKTNAGSVATLSFTCVAWFEGTDPHVVNTVDTIYDTVLSYMNFKTEAIQD